MKMSFITIKNILLDGDKINMDVVEIILLVAVLITNVINIFMLKNIYFD